MNFNNELGTGKDICDWN